MKIFLKLIGILVAMAANVNAQHTLTAINTAPVAGIKRHMACDSTGSIAKSQGVQLWDFQNFVQKPSTGTTTYVAVGSACNSTAFPGATLAAQISSGCIYYRSTATEFTELGYTNGFKIIGYNYKHFSWPFSLGSSFTHSYTIFSGSGFSNQYSQSRETHNYTVTATGSGTVILPGGQTVDNVLQVITLDTMQYREYAYSSSKAVDSSFARTITYDYYSPDDRYPMVTVHYSRSTRANPVVSILLNLLFPTSVTENEIVAGLKIFPNPATEDVKIEVPNTGLELCIVELYNVAGQRLKAVDAGNGANILVQLKVQDLCPGLYFVRISQGRAHTTKKIIVR